MTVLRSLPFAALVGLSLAAVVFIVVRWVPFGEYPGEAFFDLAAQTIPILLVALAVEAQARRFDLEKAGRRIRIAAVIFLACGETAAVAVSAALVEPERGTFAADLLVVVTAVGLLGGFFAVIAVALRTPSEQVTGFGVGVPGDGPRSPMPSAPPSAANSRPTAKRPGIFSALVGVLIGTLALKAVRR